MKTAAILVLTLASLLTFAQPQPPVLTIYNQSFAVVRESVPLDLQPGVNTVSFSGITSHLEPDSVMLRDPQNQRSLQILEQNYRNDPVSQELLLSAYEGQTIDFILPNGDHRKGKIVRSGYVPRYTRYDNSVAASQQPIIEMDGELRFGLPGQPLFPSITSDSILKPALNWQIETDKPGRFVAELSYVTSGLRWEADYNLVANSTGPSDPKGDTADLVGWVTLENFSGRTFEEARLKLIAGDVQKIQQPQRDVMMKAAMAAPMNEAVGAAVTERSFDEYHMYTLQRATTLHDQETKQVEFVRATGISTRRVYLYDGAAGFWSQYQYYSPEQLRVERDLGTQSNTKVFVVQEVVNSKANRLGMPLPKGRLRFYRRDIDGHLEFTGESQIDHTPKDETIRVYTGNAFDLTGQRKRIDYRVDSAQHWIDETFEIRVKNHKDVPVTITVVEHMYRWNNWKIMQASHEYKKTDAQRVEFAVPVQANGEQVVTYTVHYSW